MNSRLLDTNTQRLALLLVCETFLRHLLLLAAWEQPTRQVKLSIPHKDTSLRNQVATIFLQKSNRRPQVHSNLEALICIHEIVLRLSEILFSKHNSTIRPDITSDHLYPHTTRIISIRLAPLHSIPSTIRRVTTQRLRARTRVCLQNHKSKAESDDRQTCNITNKTLWVREEPPDG